MATKLTTKVEAGGAVPQAYLASGRNRHLADLGQHAFEQLPPVLEHLLEVMGVGPKRLHVYFVDFVLQHLPQHFHFLHCEFNGLHNYTPSWRRNLRRRKPAALAHALDEYFNIPRAADFG